MNITPEYLIERKRTKLQLARWKIITLILVMIILGLAGKKVLGPEYLIGSGKPLVGDYVGRITIEEIISDNLSRAKKIEALSEDKNLKALIVHINSPGGSVVGSEMLYNSFRKLAKEKPIVIVMDSVAASGGYLIALGGDYIIAHNGTVTGSIGVLMQTAEVTELAEKIGVKFNNFKSNPLKANPSLTEKLTPEAEQAIMDNVIDVYDYFTELVALRRKLDIDTVKKIADGRVYSAKLAKQYKLIDEIGNEDTALEWLEKNKEIKGLKILDVKLKDHKKFIDMLLDDFNNSIKNLISVKLFSLKAIW